jgi:transposase
MRACEAPNRMAIPKKTSLAAHLALDVGAEVDALVGRGVSQEFDLEALETAVRRQALRLAARAIERRINADLSDFTGPHLPCSCGCPARYAGRRSKAFQSVLGELTLDRAYYHCPSCGHGFCPRDLALDLRDSNLTPGVVRMVGTVGAMVSFQEGSALLEELAGVKVDAKQVERYAEALGAEIADDERRHVAAIESGALPSTLYLGIDGTAIPMRASELNGRVGKQSDGSAKTREVKLCTVWSAETRDANDVPVRDAGSVTYSAAIESAATLDTDEHRSEFSERVLREAGRRRFTEAEHTVVIGDGAAWIWNIAGELFPRAVQIVDRFHVKETIHRTAHAIYGASSERAAQWAGKRCKELDDGHVPKLLRALDRHAASWEEARKCALYIRRNRNRIRYPEFRAQGFCTSSGVVEAGCKVTIGTRLKRAGMHWTLRGSNAIIALRCCRLSGRFQDFWERRTDRLAA